MQQRIGPSRWWHLLAALIFLVCAVGAPVGLVLGFLSLLSEGEQFLVPGERTVNLRRPGKYVIFHCAETFYKGRQYTFDQTLPGNMTISVVETRTGRQIETQPTLATTETSGNTKRHAVCAFQVGQPGEHAIRVDGLSEQRVFMVRKSLAGRVIGLFLIFGLASLIGWIVPPVMVAVVEIKRYKHKKAASSKTDASPNLPISQSPSR